MYPTQPLYCDLEKIMWQTVHDMTISHGAQGPRLQGSRFCSRQFSPPSLSSCGSAPATSASHPSFSQIVLLFNSFDHPGFNIKDISTYIVFHCPLKQYTLHEDIKIHSLNKSMKYIGKGHAINVKPHTWKRFSHSHS